MSEANANLPTDWFRTLMAEESSGPVVLKLTRSPLARFREDARKRQEPRRHVMRPRNVRGDELCGVKEYEPHPGSASQPPDPPSVCIHPPGHGGRHVNHRGHRWGADSGETQDHDGYGQEQR